jgi:hypothetical protein
MLALGLYHHAGIKSSLQRWWECLDKLHDVKFQVLTEVKMMFWAVTQCGLMYKPRRWRQYVSPKLLYPPASLHGVKTQNSNIVKLHDVDVGLQNWRWKQYVLPKRRYPYTSPQGVTTQKTTKKKSKDEHPCVQWDSNTWSQRAGGVATVGGGNTEWLMSVRVPLVLIKSCRFEAVAIQTYDVTNGAERSQSWILIVAQLVKKFPVFYETQRFITVFTWASHWTLSWARLIQSTSLSRI